MTNPNATGAIIFTTDGTDPRLPGGTIAAERADLFRTH